MKRQTPARVPGGECESVESRASGSRIAAVVEFISKNIDGDLSLGKLADVAGVSPFHFHRQFRGLVGLGVARLVRLLRLRRAALQLAFEPNRSITEISFASGFGNTDSFARAFRRVYGQPPVSFRRRPIWITDELVGALSRLQEKQMNKEVEIVEFPETHVAAVEYRGPPQDEYSAVLRLVAWRRENGVRPDQGKTIGVHYSDPSTCAPDDYRIDICVSYEGDVCANSHGVVAKSIPGGRCARIRHYGSREFIGEVDYIYRIWLPDSGEQLRDFPPFFHYVNVGTDVAEAEMITDVYLPLV